MGCRGEGGKVASVSVDASSTCVVGAAERGQALNACTHMPPTGAALAAVGEGTLDNVLGCGLDVGVGAHDGGVLAAQLHLQLRGQEKKRPPVAGADSCGACCQGRSPGMQQPTTTRLQARTWMGTMPALWQMEMPVSPPVKEMALTMGWEMR